MKDGASIGGEEYREEDGRLVTGPARTAPRVPNNGKRGIIAAVSILAILTGLVFGLVLLSQDGPPSPEAELQVVADFMATNEEGNQNVERLRQIVQASPCTFSEGVFAIRNTEDAAKTLISAAPSGYTTVYAQIDYGPHEGQFLVLAAQVKCPAE